MINLIYRATAGTFRKRRKRKKKEEREEDHHNENKEDKNEKDENEKKYNNSNIEMIILSRPISTIHPISTTAG